MTPDSVQAASGQPIYLGAMITGLAMLLLVVGQLLLAVLIRWRPRARSRATWREAHRLMGILLVVLVLVHPFSYVLAVFRRAGRHAPAAIVRSLVDGSYYGSSLLLGLLGALLIAGLALWQLGGRGARWLHPWIRLGVALGAWHALRIGSHVGEGIGGLLLRASLALIVAESLARAAGAAWRWRRGTAGTAVRAAGLAAASQRGNGVEGDLSRDAPTRSP